MNELGLSSTFTGIDCWAREHQGIGTMQLATYPTYVPIPPISCSDSVRVVKMSSGTISVSDVKILSPDKVVQVIFADGTREKAVCSENDTFSLETGITVCIAKKLLGGSKEYNKTVRNALKAMERNERIAKEQSDRKKRIAKKQKKRAEKRRERQIKIQEEAYYRAMKRIDNENKKED